MARRKLRIAVVALLAGVAIVSSSTSAQRAGAPENFDVRRSRSAETSAYLGRFAPSRADFAGARAAGLARLQRDLPAIELEMSPQLGTPEVVGRQAGVGFLTEPSQDRPAAMRSFLSGYADVYGLSQEQVDGLVLIADYVNPAGNMAWVEFEQRLNGLPVFQGLIRGGFTARGELARTTGPLAAGLDAASLSTSPSLTAAQAISRAAGHVGWAVPEGGLVQKGTDAGGRAIFDRGPMAGDAKAWLVYFPLSPGLARLAWVTEIWGNPDVFMIAVDAEDGSLLFRKNLTNYQTQPASYRAYTSDSPAPLSPSNALPGTNTQAPVVVRNLFTLIGNEGVKSFNNLGWMTDGTNVTDGNNVEAGLDRNGTDGVDAPVAGVARVFDFAANPAPGSPGPGDSPLLPAFQNAEVTDGFYWTNEYHDRLYLLGFTEIARNFQNDNFGRGGLQADRVRGEFQDSSGTNNANFSTPSDGGRGRMQMYIFDFPTPDRTSGLDHDVLLHELTHGTSNRLHNNGSGLTTIFSGGMGEGWSDFYARALLSTANEDVNAIYTTGGWVTYQLGGAAFTDNYYYGIRRFPYASRSTLGANGRPHNPLTFADVDAAQINTTDGAYPNSPIIANTAFQVHNIGQIWASALLEVRALFIGRQGFALGNERFLQFVTDGMKLDPVNPNFLQGRNSILAAAVAGGGTQDDIDDIWSGFAIRGMGYSAQVLSDAAGSVIEAFDVPGIAANGGSLVAESVPNGRLDAGETVTVSLCITNNAAVTSGLVNGSLLATGGVQSPSAPQSYGMVAPAGNVCHTFSFIVGAACGSTLTATLRAYEQSAGLTRDLRYSFTVGNTAGFLTENFDGVVAPALPGSWATSTLSGTANLWATNLTTPHTAPNRVFTGNPSTISDNVLVSPIMLAPAGGSVVSFQNHYNTEFDAFGFYDGGVLEISIGGGAFTDIIAAGGSFISGGYNATLGSGFGNPLSGRQAWSGNSGGYIPTAVTMPAAAAGQNVILRFRMGSDNIIGATGWAIDTFAVSSYTCSTIAPTITTHPQSQAVMSGTTATLTVVAAGSGPLTYQWYQGVSPSTAVPVGTNSPSFTTPVLVAATNYWVRVSNGGGFANSTTAALTIGPANGVEMVQNGSFNSGTTNWSVFEVPDIIFNVVAGVFQFHRANPTTTPSTQATVFQETGQPVAAGTALRATFDIGNSSTARKRISVLIIDSNFSDITVCTFWLLPGAPMRPYSMRTHTTKNWANAAIYFYAATKGADGGNYLLDNVSLTYQAAQPTTRTDCVDPTTPMAPGGATSANMLANGSFATGTDAGWGEFGNLNWQVAGNVFEFSRFAPALPAGVVLQSTSQAAAINEILTATFQLGNSSAVRKRVTVILHDLDFSDLMACTFWLPPGQELSQYTIRGYVTEAWTNATLSVYAATIGLEQWTRLDNAYFLRTPSSTIVGTECFEPGSAPLFELEPPGKDGSSGQAARAPAPAVRAPVADRPSTSGGRSTGDDSRPGEVFVDGDGPRTVWQETLDLRDTDVAGLSLESFLVSDQSQASIEVSLDGTTWDAIGMPPPADDWLMINVDLTPYAGQLVQVRMRFDGGLPRFGAARDVWGIRDVRVTRR